jgi:hypothetical protein
LRRQVGGLCAPEDAIDVRRAPLPHVDLISSV